MGSYDSYGLGEFAAGSEAREINDVGQVAIQSCTSSSCRAFLWDNGTIESVGSGSVRGLNDAGQLLLYDFDGFDAWVVLWSGGVRTELAKPDDWVDTLVLNERGEVLVGTRKCPSQNPRCVGFLWHDGETTEFIPPEGSWWQLSDLNERGQVLLAVGPSTRPWNQLVIWEAGVFTQVEGLPCDVLAPVALDDAGRVLVAGQTILHEHEPDARAFVWEAGNVTVLEHLGVPHLAVPRRMNAIGDVIGELCRYDCEQRAGAFWRGGRIMLLPGTLVAMNDAGQITGTLPGYAEGDGAAVLWQVLPSPAGSGWPGATSVDDPERCRLLADVDAGPVDAGPTDAASADVPLATTDGGNEGGCACSATRARRGAAQTGTGFLVLLLGMASARTARSRGNFRGDLPRCKAVGGGRGARVRLVEETSGSHRSLDCATAHSVSSATR